MSIGSLAGGGGFGIGSGGQTGIFEMLFDIGGAINQFVGSALGQLTVDWITNTENQRKYDEWLEGTYEPFRRGEIDRFNEITRFLGIPGITEIPGGTPGVGRGEFGSQYRYQDAEGRMHNVDPQQGGAPNVPSDWTLVRGPNPTLYETVTSAVGETSQAAIDFFSPVTSSERFNRFFDPVLGAAEERTAAGLARGEDITGTALDQFNMAVAQGTGIISGFEQREEEGMALLEGLGRAEEADIRQDFASLGGTLQQRLAARGFGGSAAAGVASGVQRAQTGALGRLDERLRREQIDAFTGLSADTLEARRQQQETERVAGADFLTALTGQQTAEAGFLADENTIRESIAKLGFSDEVSSFLNAQAAGMAPAELELFFANMGIDFAGSAQVAEPQLPQFTPTSSQALNVNLGG